MLNYWPKKFHWVSHLNTFIYIYIQHSYCVAVPIFVAISFPTLVSWQLCSLSWFFSSLVRASICYFIVDSLSSPIRVVLFRLFGFHFHFDFVYAAITSHCVSICCSCVMSSIVTFSLTFIANVPCSTLFFFLFTSTHKWRAFQLKCHHLFFWNQ